MRESIGRLWRKNSVILIFLLIYLLAGITQRSLFVLPEFGGLLLKSIALLITVLGLGLIMIGGGIDLSVGNQISLTAAVVAALSGAGLPAAIVVIGALLTGLLCGLLNGVMISSFQIPPFAATIGTQVIFYGASFFISEGRMSSNIPEVIRDISRADVLWKRADVWMLAVCLIIVFILMRFSVVGKYLRASGLNEETALRTGVPVKQVHCFSYMFGGVCYSAASLIMVSGRGYAGSEIGLQMEIIAIIAVYISGVLDRSVNPGIWKLILGALTTSILSSGNVNLGGNRNIHYILLGVVMLITMAANRKK